MTTALRRAWQLRIYSQLSDGFPTFQASTLLANRNDRELNQQAFFGHQTPWPGWPPSIAKANLRHQSSVIPAEFSPSSLAPTCPGASSGAHRCFSVTSPAFSSPQSVPPPTSTSEERKQTSAAQSWPPPPVHWIETAVPTWCLPYVHLARLHKPIGTWLLAWPCFWSIAMAAPTGGLPDASTMVFFGTGALLLRGAGCTINDMWDRRVDAQVERTRYRPLAAGVIGLPQATAFLAAQLTLGLGILLQLNPYSQALGAASLALVATYPLAKRVTNLPQAHLGLTINWGALLGWAAVRGSCDWAVVLPLYLSGAAWTMIYDTLYAHMDKRDDERASVKSTALLFGTRTKPILYGFAAAAAGLQVASGVALGAGLPYYLGVAGGLAHLTWQVSTVDLNVPADCLNKFKSNVGYGAIVTTGIVLDKLSAGHIM